MVSCLRIVLFLHTSPKRKTPIFISKLKLFNWCQLSWNLFHVCLALSLSCLVSPFRVSTCFEYSCSETKLHICHWLQWLYDVHWISATVVGGWVFTHLRVACCTHPPTTATSHSLSPKRAGLTIPHLSVDKKVLRLCLRCACPFQEFLCLYIFQLWFLFRCLSFPPFTSETFRCGESWRRFFLFECDDTLMWMRW